MKHYPIITVAAQEYVQAKNGIQIVIRARRSTQEAEEAPLLRV